MERTLPNLRHLNEIPALQCRTSLWMDRRASACSLNIVWKLQIDKEVVPVSAPFCPDRQHEWIELLTFVLNYEQLQWYQEFGDRRIETRAI